MLSLQETTFFVFGDLGAEESRNRGAVSLFLFFYVSPSASPAWSAVLTLSGKGDLLTKSPTIWQCHCFHTFYETVEKIWHVVSHNT